MLWNEINNDNEFRLTMLWKITAPRMTEEIWPAIYLALFFSTYLIVVPAIPHLNTFLELYSCSLGCLKQV